MFKFKWSKNSIKTLEKLPKDISKRIVHKVNSLKLDPFRYLKPYEGESCYKLRVGNYRVLVDVEYKNLTIYIRILGHRKKIYKKKINF